jgi:hypothetical protein
MVKLVDTYVSGAYAVRCAGSSPVPGTDLNRNVSLAEILLIKFLYGDKHFLGRLSQS